MATDEGRITAMLPRVWAVLPEAYAKFQRFANSNVCSKSMGLLARLFLGEREEKCRAPVLLQFSPDAPAMTLDNALDNSQANAGPRKVFFMQTLLLVEDNPGDVELTKAALRRCKLTNRLTVASDGEIALSILRKEGEYRDAPNPDIILLDLILPTITGAEVLAEIKQEPRLKRILVVIMTSSKAE